MNPRTLLRSLLSRSLLGTPRDLADLEFVAPHADLVGLSFANSAADVEAGKVRVIAPEGFLVFKRATVSFDVSRIQFKYGDFRNIKNYNINNGYAVGTEPLYRFDAMVYQVYMSMFF